MRPSNPKKAEIDDYIRKNHTEMTAREMWEQIKKHISPEVNHSYIRNRLNAMGMKAVDGRGGSRISQDKKPKNKSEEYISKNPDDPVRTREGDLERTLEERRKTIENLVSEKTHVQEQLERYQKKCSELERVNKEAKENEVAAKIHMNTMAGKITELEEALKECREENERLQDGSDKQVGLPGYQIQNMDREIQAMFALSAIAEQMAENLSPEEWERAMRWFTQKYNMQILADR
jgi:predicted RNase H-like nuclease (RuvC/YqgF family)